MMQGLVRSLARPCGRPLDPRGCKGVRSALRKHISTGSLRGSAVPMTFTKHSEPRRSGGSRQPPLIIMHGLMGSKMNWKSMAKAIATKTGREVYTVDARNHGDSPHTDAHSYPLLAADLLLFMQQHSIPTAALMGHSMGGRAVMAAALTEPSVIEKLLVLDISPIGTSKSISSLPRFLEIMRRVTLPPDLTPQEARKHVDDLLKPAVAEPSIRQFLLTNLTQTPAGDGYMWKVNVEGIARNFNPQGLNLPP
ncbi:protein ABHD11-like [Eriocheir sinensis]|uniref:protein ABHD11-like n=1 Tax=Eriocheir sinensis TaxID=95602 RepID=UPI0021C9744F|nr:protein ABHD11-like [Eriocheir sinensis]